ncbi:MAG TPA: hypothetical protein VEG34_18665 [Thermoanaerobaculia bacterium]|nr:hypothetical protein [Thermoanaerobaculia bacterium]
MDCKEAELLLLDEPDEPDDSRDSRDSRDSNNGRGRGPAPGTDHPLSLSEHLASCPRCRERRQWLALAGAEFRNLPPERPSADFDRRLRERVGRLEREQRVLRRLHLPSTLLMRGVHPPQAVLAALVGLLALGLTWTILGTRPEAPPSLPLRIAFERVALGDLPAGWAVPPPAAAAGYAAATIADAEAPGGRGVRLRALSSIAASAPGELLYGLDAQGLRGQAVRLRAPLRYQGSSGSADSDTAGARLVLRIETSGGIVESTSPPVSAAAWTPAEVVARVPVGAVRLELGLRVEGGTAWIGPAVLEPASAGR